MNVRCPSCETLYRVDPDKVPAEGVRASCVSCGSVFLVTHRTSDEMAAPSVPESAAPRAEVETITRQTGAEETATEEPQVAAGPPVGEQPRASVADIDQVAATHAPAETAVEVPKPVPPEPVPQPPAADVVADTVEPTAAPAEPEATDRPKAPHFELATSSEAASEPPPSRADPEEAGRPRFSRPFVQPRGTEGAAREAPSAPPMRPSAPVFRPTPGMPVRTPPVPDAPPKPAPKAAPIADIRPSKPAPAAPAAKRPVNPFLSRDPNQKARRLARALVSDMIVYQPKKRQDALEAGTLKDAFEEEIKKSWEEYVQQVGEELAESTDFFTEALNDILAGGRRVF